jgi:hypothetical protein
MKRTPSNQQLLEKIKDVVAGYSNAPDDLRGYTWLSAPKYWDSLAVPGTDRMIEPRHEDRHGGVAFRVGWSESERVAAIWIL